MLEDAARLLRDGGLVAFPTETVYGLAADATNPQAIARLNRVKGRPPHKPYSLHLHSIEQVREVVAHVPPQARRLMERFWPGPLTIVIPYHGPSTRPSASLRIVVSERSESNHDMQTVGLRVPDHPIAQAFLKACGVPVAAPSANASGTPPPTDAQQVLAGLDGAFDCLLDGGPCRLGRESTVVSVTAGGLDILREGAISKETIRSFRDGD